MSASTFIFDMRSLKYRCVLAYFHYQLKEAERLTELGEGMECVRDSTIVQEALIKIQSKIKEIGCTEDDIINLSKTNSIIATYYNTTSKVVRKYFSKEDSWIPSLLTLEVLRLFQEKGYKEFNDIDFLKIQDEFELFKDEKRKVGLVSKHFKCAEEIVKTIDKKKVFKKRKDESYKRD